MKDSLHTRFPSILFISGSPSGIGHVFRVQHTVEALNFQGLKAHWCSFDDKNLVSYLKTSRIVVLFRVKWNTTIETVFIFCQQYQVALIYDIDDLIFEPELMKPEVFAYLDILPERKRVAWADDALLYQRALEHCNAAILSTEPLAKAAVKYCSKVFVLPNTLNLAMEKMAGVAMARPKHSATDNRIRIGFASGTPTHHRDFALAATALTHILSARKDILLVIVGYLDISEFPGLCRFRDQIELRLRVPLDMLFSEIAGFDINLSPLEVGNPFCEAKSELRYIFASALGVPTVASPTVPLKNAVIHQETGLLAGDDREWETALTDLIDNPGLRKKMGETAKLNIGLAFGWQRKLELSSHIFSSIL